MAATHWGNCQICGREHKVTGISIAKHGYTIRHGWQEGACYGSGGKPIQISCDLIEGAIAAAKRYIERTTADIERLHTNPLNEQGRIIVMLTKQTRAGSVSELAAVRVQANDKGEVTLVDGYDKVRKTYDKRDSANNTVEKVVARLAAARIAYLQQTIADARDNIPVLEQRIKEWQPEPLRAISGSDRAAEAPKVHFKAAKYGYKDVPMCAASAMGAQRSQSARTTDDASKVTCAGCLKRIAEREARQRAKEAAQ